MLLSKENFRTWFIDDFLMLLMLVSRSGQEDFEKWLLYYLEGYTWGCCSWLIKKKDHTSLSYLLVFLFSFFFFLSETLSAFFSCNFPHHGASISWHVNSEWHVGFAEKTVVVGILRTTFWRFVFITVFSYLQVSLCRCFIKFNF